MINEQLRAFIEQREELLEKLDVILNVLDEYVIEDETDPTIPAHTLACQKISAMMDGVLSIIRTEVGRI